jgi:hypothetical protein
MDVENFLGYPITFDSDERSPEQLFYDEHMLGNNRAPFCSARLKAARMQKFFQDGDIIIFGIGANEPNRAVRLVAEYQKVAVKTGKYPKLRFPLIENKMTRDKLEAFWRDAGIEIPEMYRLGFQHNNCSGGCVRAGKAQWRHLYRVMPDVYAERERVEREFNARFDGNYSFMPDLPLTKLREAIEMQMDLFDDAEEDAPVECVGICELFA